MKTSKCVIAATLALVSVTVSAIAQDVRIMPASGQAAFDSEAVEFSRAWGKVCYTGASTSWRAWLNPVDIPSDAGSFYGYRWGTGGSLIESRVASWDTNGGLYSFSTWSTTNGAKLGPINVPTDATVAVHTRMKTDAAGTDACLLAVRASYWP